MSDFKDVYIISSKDLKYLNPSPDLVYIFCASTDRTPIVCVDNNIGVSKDSD